MVQSNDRHPEKKREIWRAYIVNHYEGKFSELPELFDSRDQAQDALLRRKASRFGTIYP